MIFYRDSITYIEERMAQLVPANISLRLICLLSYCSDGLTQGGIFFINVFEIFLSHTFPSTSSISRVCPADSLYVSSALGLSLLNSYNDKSINKSRHSYICCQQQVKRLDRMILNLFREPMEIFSKNQNFKKMISRTTPALQLVLNMSLE